jgi:hypothetical protein
MAYQIQHTNPMGSATTFGGHTASDALAKLKELRGLGSIIFRIVDLDTNATVEESQLRQRSGQEAAEANRP